MVTATVERASEDDVEAFELDVKILEITDPVSLVYATDNGCGSTCSACTTGFH